MSGSPEHDPRIRIEISPGRSRQRIVEVFCLGCGERTAVAEFPSLLSAVELTIRNRTARPCCAVWIAAAPPGIAGQLELELEGKGNI